MNDWFVDSGVNLHMTIRKDFFVDLNPSQIKEIYVANREKLEVEAMGNIDIQLQTLGKVIDITIYDVLYVPDLIVNLLSVSRITRKGYSVKFLADKCIIQRDDEIIATVNLVENMFKLDGNTGYM